MQETKIFISFLMSYSDPLETKIDLEVQIKLAYESILEYSQKLLGRLECTQVPFNITKDDSVLYEREACLVVRGTTPPSLAE
jgi:hypothetical protein